MRHILATLVLAAVLAVSASAARPEENPFTLVGNPPSVYQIWQQWESQHSDHSS